MAIHPSILAWKISRTEEPWLDAVPGVAELDTTDHARVHVRARTHTHTHTHTHTELLMFYLGFLHLNEIGVYFPYTIHIDLWYQGYVVLCG